MVQNRSPDLLTSTIDNAHGAIHVVCDTAIASMLPRHVSSTGGPV